MQFVSATMGWLAGNDRILATADGGAHWSVQLTGSYRLSSVDFISGKTGWAVGADTLLTTSDGGAHWTALPEPCPVIRSVHFVSPRTGFAIAGGTNIGGIGPRAPMSGGVVLTTTDGGRSWRPAPAPADAQTVCFTDPRRGWLGADGRLYATSDGGAHWTVRTARPASEFQSQDPPTMVVECAGSGAVWAVDEGPGGEMSQQPHVGYHADQAGAAAIFAENYFEKPGAYRAQSPGSEAGPFSAISPSVAAFIDYCPACGTGAAPWDMATGSGAHLTREGNVSGVALPEAVSFVSPMTGWVAGEQDVFTRGSVKRQQRIVFTADGGRTWHVQYAGPWTT
jgi:Photosynthesis system II assembly factor YCF48